MIVLRTIVLNKPGYTLDKTQLLECFEKKLAEVLVPTKHATLLMEAMRYSTLDGGKRIRPLLVAAAGRLSDASLDSILSVGAAVELIHCYSLIHDDLPAMDNDDLRRGRPTCHKKYNEALAILAGDALQTQAFTVLSCDELEIKAMAKLKIINLLSICAGALGMVGGQAIDLMSTGLKLDIAALKHMHSMKTGALIKASVLSGYLAGRKFELNAYNALTNVANNLGLLFQITDDILDATGDTQTLGKTANKDLLNNKATYVNILGLSEAQNMATKLYHDNLSMLEQLAHSTELIELTHIVYKRNS